MTRKILEVPKRAAEVQTPLKGLFKAYLTRALCLALLPLWLTGCLLLLVGTGAGVGTYSYVKGALEHEYPVPLDRTYNATLSAIKQLQLIVIEQKKDSLGATIVARRADDTKVSVWLEPVGAGSTRVTIRVGVFPGDRDAAIRIDNEIQRALGKE